EGTRGGTRMRHSLRLTAVIAALICGMTTAATAQDRQSSGLSDECAHPGWRQAPSDKCRSSDRGRSNNDRGWRSTSARTKKNDTDRSDTRRQSGDRGQSTTTFSPPASPQQGNAMPLSSTRQKRDAKQNTGSQNTSLQPPAAGPASSGGLPKKS